LAVGVEEAANNLPALKTQNLNVTPLMVPTAPPVPVSAVVPGPTAVELLAPAPLVVALPMRQEVVSVESVVLVTTVAPQAPAMVTLDAESEGGP
jgi:hypothetical protein